MVMAQASVAMDRAQRYAKQLCNHANRMGAVANWTPPVGVVEFPQGGACRMIADGTSLSLTAVASTLDQLAIIQAMVSADLQRFSRCAIGLTWTGDQPRALQSEPGIGSAHTTPDH